MKENELKLPKTIYHSKKDLFHAKPPIKTEKNENISEISKTNLIPIKTKYANLSKKNLTYQNIYDYNYDINNITENKIRMPDHLKIKQKYELLIDSDYPSFISKNSNKNNNKKSHLLITGLDTPNNKYKKYSEFLTGTQKSFENSDLKTKSTSSNKNTKSFFFNYNYSNKNDFLFSSSLSKSFIHFHGSIDKFTKNENKDEGLKAFVQKSKIILREKIIKQELEKKLSYQNELNFEAINMLNKKKDSINKHYELLSIYDDVFIHYLRTLKQEEAKEKRLYNLLNKKKIDLENEVTNLMKKIQKKNNELIYFQSIKRFFQFSKSGIESLSKKEKEDEINIKKEPTIKDKQLKDFGQNLLKLVGEKLLSYRQKKNSNIKEKPKINFFARYNSIKPQIKKSEPKLILNEINNKEKTERSTSKKNKNILDKRISRRKSSILVHKNQYDYIFTNVENKILRNIEISTIKKRQLFEETKNLELSEKYNKKTNQYIDELIIKKEKIFENLKNENYILEQKLKIYSKTSKIKGLSQDALEEKMITIIYNIKPKINIPEIVKMKNLYSMLGLEPQDFLEHFRTEKIMFLLKIIELIISYLISKKTEYLSDPKFKETFKNFLNGLENEKKLRMNNMNKIIIKTQIEKRKAKAYDKSTRIRFFSYRKFDLRNYKNRKNKYLKNKDNNQTMKDDQYEEWILYD